MVFVNFRWNYSPLKKRPSRVAGRPFALQHSALSLQQSAFLKSRSAAGIPGRAVFACWGSRSEGLLSLRKCGGCPDDDRCEEARETREGTQDSSAENQIREGRESHTRVFCIEAITRTLRGE